jgi:hypothetical protein
MMPFLKGKECKIIDPLDSKIMATIRTAIS